MNAIFRAAGDATIAMRVLWLANGINLVLDPCLIFGLGPFPELGVVGAAVATTTGRSTAVLIQLACCSRGGGGSPWRARHLQLVPGGHVDGVPALGNGSAADPDQHVELDRTRARDLDVRQRRRWRATRSASARSCSPCCRHGDWPMPRRRWWGRASGAGKPERAEQAVWTACFYNLVFLGTSARCSLSSRRRLSRIYTSRPRDRRHAVACLRIVSLGFVFYAFGMVLTQSFNGAGDTWTPTWINIGCFWLWEIPLAWLLALQLGFGPRACTSR